MGMFSRLFNRVAGKSEPLTKSRIIHVGLTTAGVYIDADTALRNSVVWACVQYLTRAIAQLPWHVMSVDNAGKRQIASNHPVDWLLNKRPSPEYGSFSFRQTIVGHAVLRGNGYAEIEWDNRGMPYALWPIHPDRVAPRRSASGELEYEVWNPSGNTIVAARDMFHVRGYGDGPIGLSVIDYAAESIGWARATELFGSTYFGEGMNPTIFIKAPAGLSEPAKEVMREELEQLYKGVHGKRAFIGDAGMDAVKLTTNPNDSQFIETRQHQVEEICRWFGVPPHKVMHHIGAFVLSV